MTKKIIKKKEKQQQQNKPKGEMPVKELYFHCMYAFMLSFVEVDHT